MDSPRQWNTIPAGGRYRQPPESFSHTPLPCQSQTQPSLEIWDRWRDGERMVEERRNVKEQWIGADGKKKGGTEGNWHPSLCKTTMENRWFLSNLSENQPYLDTQHDTYTQVTITTNNTMLHTPLRQPHLSMFTPPSCSVSVSADLRCSQSRQHWHTVAMRAIHSTGTVACSWFYQLTNMHS